MRAGIALGLLTATLLVAGAGLSTTVAQSVATPNFWDQRQRLSRPVLPELSRIRFLTTVDYPPFNFLDPRGRLAGFNVELARAICEELEVTALCQIEAKPFAELLPALERGEGEAVIAGLAVTADNREKVAFTHSYFRYPARLVTRKETPLPEAAQAELAGIRVGVGAGTAHDAMLRAFFPKAVPVPAQTREAALEALRAGSVDAVFGDGVGLSFWLASENAGGCCDFSGGPYLSDRFLGEGLAIGVKAENADLARAFDYAIGRLVEKGRFSELLLRSFPISAF